MNYVYLEYQNGKAKIIYIKEEMLDYIPIKYCDKMIKFNENKKQLKNFEIGSVIKILFQEQSKFSKSKLAVFCPPYIK